MSPKNAITFSIIFIEHEISFPLFSRCHEWQFLRDALRNAHCYRWLSRVGFLFSQISKTKRTGRWKGMFCQTQSISMTLTRPWLQWMKIKWRRIKLLVFHPRQIRSYWESGTGAKSSAKYSCQCSSFRTAFCALVESRMYLSFLKTFSPLPHMWC